MLLVIDAGNSNLTLGVFRGAELLAQGRLLTERDKTAEEYGVEIHNLFARAGVDVKEVTGIAIASVVPQLDQQLAEIAARDFGVTPLFVDHTTNTALKLLYDTPSELGADRIVDAAAALAKYGAPCIVVDFGTATTFNAVNEAHEYLGGVIAPGVMISAEALFSRAAKLPRVEIERPQRVIATSTRGAMQSGLYHGYAGLVDGVLEKMIAEMNSQPHVIATGGLAPRIAAASKYIEKIDETLTLDGLRLIYERNN
ncbi:MAG TPA: type III pantothenate kinase [Pyrinomonadaceae bacterium]|jgi:type III pantothenate kinase|nr:type III pantothenate kinase [Pyrinomonadaceae bacterium]